MVVGLAVASVFTSLPRARLIQRRVNLDGTSGLDGGRSTTTLRGEHRLRLERLHFFLLLSLPLE